MSYIKYQPCPYRHKYELVAWAMKRYPIETKKHWTDMDEKQLRAIFHNAK